MSKKTILVLLGFAFLFGFRLAYAEVFINEIAWMGTSTSQYEEWIELKNTGSESVSLVGWKLYKNNGTLLFSLSGTIPAGEYFLVCRTTPSVSNPLSGICNEQGVFGGSGLNNTSDLVQLKNASEAEVDLADGTTGWPAGSAETKETMQRNGLSWITAASTPGAENQISQDNNNEEVQEENPETSSSGSSKKTETKKPQIPLVNKTKITAQMPAFAGLPVEFKVSNTVSNKSCGKYSLNFGDGSFLETEKTSRIPEEFDHIYYYPGEYIVTLECYKSYLSSEPDTSDKIIIKVLSSEVVISKVGDARDFFIEISNNSFSEANISGWFLSSLRNKFVFPKNSILKAKNKIIVSSKTTNFSILDRDTLKLINSEGETISDYLSFIKPVKTLAKNSTVVSTAVKMPLGGETAKWEDGQIPAENLSAIAVKSDVNTGNNLMYGAGLLAFLGISAGSAYFIRNRNRKIILQTTGSDFEIMDE